MGISKDVAMQNAVITESIAKTMQFEKRRDKLMQELDKHDCASLFEIA